MKESEADMELSTTGQKKKKKAEWGALKHTLCRVPRRSSTLFVRWKDGQTRVELGMRLETNC